jgi:hypothetical protein
MKTPDDMDKDRNDPLDQLLQEDNVHVDDAGFTNRVTRQLPRNRRGLWKSYVHFTASFFGIVLGIWFVQSQWGNITELFRQGMSGLGSPASQEALMAIGALAIATAALIYSIFTAVNSEE